jgi:hypothetical protein
VSTDFSRIEEVQRRLCKDRQIPYLASPADSKTGFALVSKGKLPINGLRHTPGETTSGWFIWCGEQFLEQPDFLHLYTHITSTKIALKLPSFWGYLLAIAFSYRGIISISGSTRSSLEPTDPNPPSYLLV